MTGLGHTHTQHRSWVLAYALAPSCCCMRRRISSVPRHLRAGRVSVALRGWLLPSSAASSAKYSVLRIRYSAQPRPAVHW